MTEAERAALPDIAETLKKGIPCTDCRYCCGRCSHACLRGTGGKDPAESHKRRSGREKRSSEVPVRRFRGSFAFRHYLDRDQLVGETLESMCMPMPAVWAETSEAR